MKRSIPVLVFAFLCHGLYAQEEDTTTAKKLDEVIIYTTKFGEKRKNVVQLVDLISAKAIARQNAQNTGDMLINTGNIFVQKSQQGGSSPVLRGFEASRVLLVVDGVRLNNAIFRAGHLQNIITVDQNMLERTEVLYGPASTLYGSDALGGVVHFRSKQPKLSLNDKTIVTGTAFARYSSANEEKTVHMNASIGGKKFGWLQSYTFSDFGDMKMGDNYPGKYPNFGRRDSMIVTTNGIDEVVANSDDRIQKFSGYRQWDITQKFLFRQEERISHLLNVQFSNSNDIPRYDRLQDKRYMNASLGTTLRYAEWYYGPQKRLSASYELNVSEFLFANEMKFIANYQDIQESRYQREYRRYDRFDSRVEDLNVFNFILDTRTFFGQHEITAGLDAQLNDVTSTATRTNLLNGAVSPLDTRYPNGENKMNYFGLYAQHLWKSANGKFVLNDGLRLQAITLRSTIADNSIFNFPFTEIKQSPFAVTGNIGFVYMPENRVRVTASVSSGFRAPNIDDLARIFESSTAQRRLIIPNPDIKPEYTYNFEAGITHQATDLVRWELNGFYTLFRNAIAPAPFRLNGEDSVIYNGVKSAIFANQNVNSAYLYGANARLNIGFTKNLSWDNTITFTYGRYDGGQSGKIPLDHIPPIFGRSAFTYSSPEFTADLYMLFNGWKRIKDFNPNGEDNGQYATPDGMPGWFTLNFKAGYTINRHLMLQAGVENILDRNYRYFASGFSAPGRNFILAIRGTL